MDVIAMACFIVCPLSPFPLIPKPQALIPALQTKQPRGVLPANALALLLTNRQPGDRLEHRRDAADLMWIVASGEDVIGAGEVDRELQRALVEVDRVVVELLQVAARRALDLRAAVLERMETAVETFGQIRDRAAQVAERPADVRVALRHAGEGERGGG